MSVATGDGPADSATVEVGDASTSPATTWQVLALTPVVGSDGAPGSAIGRVVLGRRAERPPASGGAHPAARFDAR